MRAISALEGALVLTLGMVLAGCGSASSSQAGQPYAVSAPPVPTATALPEPPASGQPPSGSVASAVAAAARAAGAASSGSPVQTVPSARQTASAQRLAAGSRLRIPSIGVDAPLVPLGVDVNGVMEVPSNGTDIGWYTFSALPGDAGNSILSGHLDTATTTAVFFRLRELKIGDPLSVLVAGRETKFQVFWTKSWPDESAPLPLILGNAPSPTLTLITCSGTFDRASKNYSGRLVVRAKLPGQV